MQHRHLVDGYEDSVEAVQDVLERGSVEDWADLARRVSIDPHGAAASALTIVLDHGYMYGTTVIWRRFLDEVLETAAGPEPCGAVDPDGHQEQARCSGGREAWQA
jgi:hypothetical protein